LPGTVEHMDEAERVLDRLRRIESLEQENAPAQVLLEEARALLAEAELWVRSEGRANERAEAAVAALRGALETREETALAAERTLVA
jgi:hypothetical protein